MHYYMYIVIITSLTLYSLSLSLASKIYCVVKIIDIGMNHLHCFTHKIPTHIKVNCTVGLELQQTSDERVLQSLAMITKFNFRKIEKLHQKIVRLIYLYLPSMHFYIHFTNMFKENRQFICNVYMSSLMHFDKSITCRMILSHNWTLSFKINASMI